MSKKTVSYTLDTLPPLTAAQKANLSSLAALPDEEIDTRDIPELSDEQWQSAVRSQFCKPTNALVTARLDRDVIQLLKQHAGLQPRLLPRLEKSDVSMPPLIEGGVQ